MLNRSEAMNTIVRENLKGGSGAIKQKILIEKEALEGYARHCVEMTLNPVSDAPMASTALIWN